MVYDKTNILVCGTHYNRLAWLHDSLHMWSVKEKVLDIMLSNHITDNL